MPDAAPWRRRVAPPGIWWAVILIAAVLIAAVAFRQWFALVAMIVPAAMLARSVVDVTVDAQGLTVRGLLGRPRTHVPAHRIAHVEAVPHVSPAQYVEGHGWHGSRGAVRGVVVRPGEALVVDRVDDVPLVVTVDDATGAAVALGRIVRTDGHRPVPEQHEGSAA